MNIEDFHKDADAIIRHFIRQKDILNSQLLSQSKYGLEELEEGGRSIESLKECFAPSLEYLNLWLNSRKYSEEEKTFLVFILKEDLMRQVVEILTIEKEIFDLEIAHNAFTKIDALFILLDFFGPNTIYPASLKSVDVKYLNAPARKDNLVIIEKSLMQIGYLSVDGEWASTNGKLAALLHILVRNQIIKNNYKETFLYFCKRYKAEELRDMARLSKAKKYFKAYEDLKKRHDLKDPEAKIKIPKVKK